MSPTAESGSGRPWGVVTGGGGLLATLCGSIWELHSSACESSLLHTGACCDASVTPLFPSRAPGFSFLSPSALAG